MDSFDLLELTYDCPDIFDRTPSFGNDGIDWPPDPEFYFRICPDEIEAFMGLKLSPLFSFENFPNELVLN